MDYIYAALFTIELVLKISVQGNRFFCIWADRSALFWNYLDLVIVGTSVFELVFDLILAFESDESAAPTQTRLLRIVRIIRVLRVMRVIKVMKFLGAEHFLPDGLRRNTMARRCFFWRWLLSCNLKPTPEPNPSTQSYDCNEVHLSADLTHIFHPVHPEVSAVELGAAPDGDVCAARRQSAERSEEAPSSFL